MKIQDEELVVIGPKRCNRAKVGLRWVLLILFGVVLVYISTGHYWRFVQLKIVTVQGASRTSLHELLRELNPLEKKTLADIKNRDIRNIPESLPWIERASLKRSFSGELRVDVNQRIPAAFVKTLSGSFYLTYDGKLLPAGVKSRGDRNDLSGPIVYVGEIALLEKEEVKNLLVRIVELIRREIPGVVRVVAVWNDGSYILKDRDGNRYRLASTDDLETKVRSIPYIGALIRKKKLKVKLIELTEKNLSYLKVESQSSRGKSL